MPQIACASQKNNAGTRPASSPSILPIFGSALAARSCAWAATATARATALGPWSCAKHRLRLHRQQAFALQFLAGQLARPAPGFGLFTGLLLGGLFIMAAELHLAENTLALHLLFQRLEGLIDIVIADENLHAASSFSGSDWNSGKAKGWRKAEPLTLRARMYQTKPAMSTGGNALARVLGRQIRCFWPDQAVFAGAAPTSVTCPILRPGRGAPLP